MNNLLIVEHKGTRVLTTAQLAEVYKTEPKNIQMNFTRNIDRFTEGKDYHVLQGAELKAFKDYTTDSGLVPQRSPSLYLWTDRGANRHCKILDTDQAWDQFDVLEETYFNVRSNIFAIPKSYAQALLLASQQAQVIEEQTLAIAHKSQVIQGLTQEIPLADKRQILNRVVRKVSNYQLRWTELYRQFELKFHMNINKRMEGYNANHKPKVKSKIDYIDEVLDQLDDLYDIACKLYESDVNSLVAEMYNLGEPA